MHIVNSDYRVNTVAILILVIMVNWLINLLNDINNY